MQPQVRRVSSMTGSVLRWRPTVTHIALDDDSWRSAGAGVPEQQEPGQVYKQLSDLAVCGQQLSELPGTSIAHSKS
jgi:hypothetical protein